MDTSAPLSATLDQVDRIFPSLVTTLAELVRIPSCSYETGPALDDSAKTCAGLLSGLGAQAQVAQIPGGKPAVLARFAAQGPDRPTILYYAHHDVQPAGEAKAWTTPPFTPVERGGRLYGRGSSDDKAGIVALLGAVRAWQDTAGGLPVQVAVLLDGEEEIGSPHLDALIQAHRDLLHGQALVVADVGTLVEDLPCFVSSLRGLVGLELDLAALRTPVHSGLWGGPLPDPVLALSRLLAGLADDQGTPSIPGLAAPVLPPACHEELARLPFDRQSFARESGLLDPRWLTDGPETYARLWHRPILTINALHAGGPPGRAGNVLNDRAWARITLRVPPGLAPQTCQQTLIDHLQRAVPPGLNLTITPERPGEPWAARLDHPFFALARQALALGHGQSALAIGSGGTIPVVATLSRLLGGDLPTLLLPVEDPRSNPHGPDESVSLTGLRLATRSLAALFGLMHARSGRE